MAAFGTTRIKCAVIPPYKAAIPSSLYMIRADWMSPVYFTGFPASGVSRNRVRNTSCGYVINAAISLAAAATPKVSRTPISRPKQFWRSLH